MGFKRSRESLEFIRDRFMRPEFVNGERITVQFLTDPEVYRDLLPPLLSPGPEPLVVVGIGTWGSNCVGHYSGGSLSLIAEHEGYVGGVALSMWMNSEPAINYGRDVLGEPKKFADASVHRDGDHVHAWIERHGARIIEIEGELGESLGSRSDTRFAFNYRSRQSTDGFSLDGPAVLTRSTFRTTVHDACPADANIMLRSTAHDPVEDIPMVQIRSAEFQRHDIVGETTPVGTVSADDFLPYHYGRLDDFTRL